MDTIIWIIVAVIWLAFSAINNSNKKKQKTQQTTQKPVPQQQQKEQPTIKDIFEEFKRQVYETQTSTNEDPKPVIVLPRKKEMREISNKQTVIEDKEIISVSEKKASMEYERFVEQTRKKEHAAEHHYQEDELYEEIEEEYEMPVIDLKNIVIADAVLHRPEY